MLPVCGALGLLVYGCTSADPGSGSGGTGGTVGGQPKLGGSSGSAQTEGGEPGGAIGSSDSPPNSGDDRVPSGEVTGATLLAASSQDGTFHTCAVFLNGTVGCWGDNLYYQLGRGPYVPPMTPLKTQDQGSSTPVLLTSCGQRVTTAVSVSANDYGGCMVLSTDEARCFGTDYSGALGFNGSLGDGHAHPLSIASNTYTCVLFSDGTVECWGEMDISKPATPTAVPGLTSATAIAVGGRSCAVLSSGAVQCWDSYVNGPTTPKEVPSVSGATAIAAGGQTCAVVTDGAVTCWPNSDMTATPVTGIFGATAVAVGDQHACALLSDGSVQCWGKNDKGQLGDGTTNDSSTPVAVSNLEGATSIAAGYEYTCAIVADGKVKCWGSNSMGQLGDGSTTDSPVPASVIW